MFRIRGSLLVIVIILLYIVYAVMLRACIKIDASSTVEANKWHSAISFTRLVEAERYRPDLIILFFFVDSMLLI